jgi:hypothetical protein
MNKPEDFINHSGGASGADTAWDAYGRKFNVTNHKHYYHGSKTPLGNIKITEEQLEEGWQQVIKANEIMKRYGIIKYKNLLSRSWFQAKNSGAVFAISHIDKNTISGGTCWCCVMAALNKKPVYLFDQNLKKWFMVTVSDTIVFKECETPVLTSNFAGIGSREINEFGLQAIESIYKKTFAL